MNKIVVGVIVLLVGGLAGWYYFGGKGNVPGMKIGTKEVSPSPLSADGNVTITDESTAMGTEKGSIPTEAAVTYTDSGYQPKEITIKKGTKVTFTNESTSSVWTASGVHPTHQLLPGFDQLKSVGKGGTYEYAFTKVGKWMYHNHVKSTDTGIVVVVE